MNASAADDSGDGLSATTAKKSLGAAFAVAKALRSGESIITLKPGTYSGASNRNIDFGGYTIKVIGESQDPKDTVIDLELAGYGFNFSSAESSGCRLERLTIRNGTGSDGGGLHITNGASPEITDCVIEGCQSTYSGGGAAYIHGSYPKFTRCILQRNSAAGDGGGAVLVRGYANALFTDCLFDANATSTETEGGALRTREGSTAKINNCQFYRNRAKANGGAIGVEYSSAILEGCRIESNYSATSGGAAYMLGNAQSSLSLTNCFVGRNIAVTNSGAIATDGSTGAVQILNSTIAWNNAPSSVQISCKASPSSWTIKNSIVLGGISNVNSSCVTYCCTTDAISGTGNFSSAPMLSSDGCLTPGSPCIDAGTSTDAPATDIHGQARPQGSAVDIGCDEFKDSNSNGLPDWFEAKYGVGDPAADPDGDGLTNLQEYQLGLNPLVADTDGDGIGDKAEVDLGYDPKTYTAQVYVNASAADDSGDGLSATTAKKSLEAALTQCKPLYDGQEYVLLINPGIYVGAENRGMDLDGHNIKIRGLGNNPENVVIDCENMGRAFSFHSRESNDCWIDGLTIRNGKVSDNGGAMYISNANPWIKNCVFESNSASNGGAIWIEGRSGVMAIDACRFKSNYSSSNGGAIYASCETMIMTNCLICLNSSTVNGSGLAIGNSNSNVSLLSCTLANNICSNGNQVWCQSTQTQWTLRNTILWGATANFTPLSANYCCSDSTLTGIGNICTFPGITSDGWLTANSPCINAGTIDGAPKTDVHGQSRPIGAGIDIGCDEFKDTNGNGLPDWFKSKYGVSNPNADDDGDGLTNLQEYLFGANPIDPVVVQIVGNNTGSQGSTDYTGTLEVRSTVAGSAISNSHGTWESDFNGIYAVDRNGWVEYSINAPASNAYMLIVTGTQHNMLSSESSFILSGNIDGISMGTNTLNASYGTLGSVKFLTPSISAGTHTVRITWNNVAPNTALAIYSIQLADITSPDSDANGVSDWLDSRTKSLTSLNIPNVSAVSPLCVEGLDATFLEQTSISGFYTPYGETPVSPSPFKGPNNSWFANVPLSPDTSNDLIVSFQSLQKSITKTVNWTPTDIIARNSSTLLIRLGDSLLLKCGDPTQGAGSIYVAGIQVPVPQGKASVPYKFETAGDFMVSATYTPTNGDPIRNGTILVRVLAASFTENPVAGLLNYARSWSGQTLPPEVTLSTDSYLSIGQSQLSSTIRNLSLCISQPRTSYIVARIGTDGSVIAHTSVVSMDYATSHQDGAFKIIETYTDGSSLLEGRISLNDIPSGVSVVISISTSGVTFDDGTTTRTVTAADFDSNGTYVFHMLSSENAKTSICHTYTIFQNGVQISGGLD